MEHSLEVEEVIGRTARLVYDVLAGAVTPETVALAETLAFTDVDFILYLAGANLDNLAEVTALAKEELERLIGVESHDFDFYPE